MRGLCQASWAAWATWAQSLPLVIVSRGVTSTVTSAPADADSAPSSMGGAGAAPSEAAPRSTAAVTAAGGGGSRSPWGKWVPWTWVLARAGGRGRTGPGTRARALACAQPVGPSWAMVTPGSAPTSSQRRPRARRTSLRIRPLRQWATASYQGPPSAARGSARRATTARAAASATSTRRAGWTLS